MSGNKLVLLLLLPVALVRPQAAARSAMLDAMKAELARSIGQFKKQPTPPYFLSYEVTETESAGANGSFGTLTSSSPVSRRRSLGIDLRVGSYQLDNTHPVRGALPIAADIVSFFPCLSMTIRMRSAPCSGTTPIRNSNVPSNSSFPSRPTSK